MDDKAQKRKTVLKMRLTTVTCLIVMVGVFSSSIGVSQNANRTAFLSSSQRKKTMSFYVLLLQETLLWTRLGDRVHGVLKDEMLTTDETIEFLDDELAELELSTMRVDASLQKLKRQQRRAKRRAPAFRSTSNEFDDFCEAVVAILELTSTLHDTVAIQNTTALLSLIDESFNFDSYRVVPNSQFDQLRLELDHTYQLYINTVDDKDKEARRVSLTLSTIALLFAFVAIICLLIALWCLSTMEEERRIAQERLMAQEDLIKQQSHEMRQRFSPAISILESYLNTDPSSFHEFRLLRSDTRTALAKLKEVETHHQLRLLVLKILRGNYELKKDIIDLGKLLHDRCATARDSISGPDPSIEVPTTYTEEESASGGQRPPPPPNPRRRVQYNVVLPSVYGPHIEVCTDCEVLIQILNGLLSNAQQYTPPGGIVNVFFVGIDKDRLIFQVHDTGIGIPDIIRNQLFSAEVTTGRSRKGSVGLGLPSCKVFAATAGGYINLLKSVCRGPGVENHGSIFEFAVQGQVVNHTVQLHRPRELCFNQYIVEEARHVGYSSFSPQLYAPVPSLSPKQSNIEPAADDLDNQPSTELVAPEVEDDSTGLVGDGYAYIESESTALHQYVPNELTVVVVDDSAINRRCLIRSVRSAAKRIDAAANNITFVEFENYEKAQTELLRLASDPDVIVTLDQSVESRGGVWTGSDCIRWLTQINFKGLMVSSSGDAEVGKVHRALGAHFVWGKPLPPVRVVEADLRTFFANRFVDSHSSEGKQGSAQNSQNEDNAQEDYLVEVIDNHPGLSF